MTTVLVVDDEDALRRVLQRALARAGFDVLEAPDGQDALTLLQTVKPHLIVTDLTMPRLNGVALARAIRADPALRDVPVLIMTSHAGATIPMDYPVLEKPFSLQLFIETVRQLIT